jgi:GNAT superfamily N-acetyltransferase
MTVEIIPAGHSRRDRKRFVQVPFDLYRDDRVWVAPLRFDVMGQIDPKKNPFFEHAEVRHFLALRDGRAVGRIAGIVNARHNEVHDERTAHFGFFEAADGEAASALIEEACRWAKARGMGRILGPASYSTNDMCGLLVDGFDKPPAILMPYNPPTYATWIEAAGFVKAKDLLALHADTSHKISPRLGRVAERLATRSGLTLRRLDMKRFVDEVGIIRTLYNRSWEKNWGFVPMTDAELDHMAAELRPVVDPRCVIFAEMKGKVVGFALALPDLNVLLAKVRSGRLFPTGLLRILFGRSRLTSMRLLTLGVLPEYRSKGIDAALIQGAITKFIEAGFSACECSWILEDNERMLAGMEMLEAIVTKRYRMYERTLSRPS